MLRRWGPPKDAGTEMAIDREKVTRTALRFTQKGQFLKAIAEYKKLLSLDPRDIRTRLKLLDLYGRAGKKSEAIAECADVAESYADQGFYLKAIAVYKQALRIDPENPSLYQDMGEMYVKQGLVGDALGAYKKGVEVLRGLGRGEEAEELLVRMEEMAPENAAIKIHLAELYLECNRFDAFEVILGKLILQLRGEGRSRKLLQAVESFYDKSAHHPSVLKRLAELYVELGEEERSLEVVREGLATQPADRELRLLALRAYLLTSQLADARRMALALCEEDPDDLHILEQLASIAQARGDQHELAGTYKAMAKVYARKGLHQKEEQYYRRVAELVPEDAEARLALGEVLLEDAPPEVGGAPEIGIGSLWEVTHEAMPVPEEDVAEGLVEAELYLKYGMEEKAAAKLAELAARAPDRVEIRTKLRDLCQRRGDRAGWVREQLHIAELFLREDRETEALRAYQAILEVEPDNTDARDGIQYLKPGIGPTALTAAPAEVDHSTVEFVQEEGREEVVRAAARPSGGDVGDKTLREGLAEADFYEAQELEDEALQVLHKLRQSYPDAPQVLSRLQRLGETAAPEGAPQETAGEFFDLQSEILDQSDLSLGSDFAGFQEFEVSELDDIVREFKSGIADRLDAGDYDTHYNLGVAYREMGLLDDAMEEFQIAARSPEKAREAYSSMAQVYQEQDRLDDARASLRLALSMPQNTQEDRVAILFELGSLAEQAEDWGAALVSYHKAAELDPSHRDLGKRLERVRGRAGG